MSYKSPFTPFDIKPSSSRWSCDYKSTNYDSYHSNDTFGCQYNFSNGASLGGFISHGGSEGGPTQGQSGTGGGLSFGFKF